MKKVMFGIFFVHLLIVFMVSSFATTEPSPYKQEVHDFLYGLLSEDMRNALQDENCYNSDIKKSDMENAVPILVLFRNNDWSLDGINTFREKVNEKSEELDWYWMLGESNFAVGVKSIAKEPSFTVLRAEKYFSAEILKDWDHKPTYPYVQELLSTIALWEREGLPEEITNVYVLDMTADSGDIFVCYEYGSKVVIKGTHNARYELYAYEFSEITFDYYLYNFVAVMEKLNECGNVLDPNYMAWLSYLSIIDSYDWCCEYVKGYYTLCTRLEEHYDAIEAQEKMEAEAIATEERKKQTLSLVVGCSGGALLMGAAIGAAVPTVILRRKKRKAAVGDVPAEEETA